MAFEADAPISEAPRDHAADDVPEYFFDRDFFSSGRLNLQHYLWREALGYHIHPRIPIPDHSRQSRWDGPPVVGEFRVADLGAGTGVWLHSLLLSLPPATNFCGVGLDISSAQFPNTNLCPPQLSFLAHDCSQEPPEDLRGVFDVVHLRLVSLVVENNDPTPFLRCAKALLKPGGWFQWDEYDHGYRRNECYGDGKRERNDELSSRIKEHKPIRWLGQLDDTFLEHGFEKVELSRLRPSPFMMKAVTEMVLMSHVENAAVLDRTGGNGNEVRGLVNGCAKELRDGTVMSHMLQVVLGRKKI